MANASEYSIKNLNEKTNAEIEDFLKKSKEELSIFASRTLPVSWITHPALRL